MQTISATRNDTPALLAEIASRANSLYSRPTVAMELVRLADDPAVGADTLKECVAQDPALACKILRVVNSSLFGLNRPVADLNQAIGLLGLKPLKLLVLGFNLPDALFAEVAARELQWYWTNTLTRAVAARMLAEQLWKQPGDEAFIAGLLQDIGILMLLRELGQPYARFLTGVIEERCHLAALEHDTLGFDHIQLSAALLERWQMPSRLVEAIALPKRPARLARLSSPEGDLPQILHLAELLMQLVGQRRYQVLPELLEAGRSYRGMTKSQLETLVTGLQPQVDQLGQVLSIELNDHRDYMQTLVEAHRQMAVLSEELAGQASQPEIDDAAHAQLLAHSGELSIAMRRFLQPDAEAAGAEPVADGKIVPRPQSALAPGPTLASSTLVRKLLSAAARCRDNRHELSLLMVQPLSHDGNSRGVTQHVAYQGLRALGIALSDVSGERVTLVSLPGDRTAAILANCDRSEAVAYAQRAIAELIKMASTDVGPDRDPSAALSIGVATAGSIPKNFDAMRMIERAGRCLAAARMSGASSVKSIEV